MIVTLAIALVLLAVRILGAPLMDYYSPDHSLEKLVTIAFVISIALLIDQLVRRFHWSGYVKRKTGRETPKLLQDLVTLCIVALGLAVGLWWQEGLTLTGIAATSIAVAAAIGVALQPDIQDVFSGLAINYEDSCSIGDWITVDSTDLKGPIYGKITSLSWRSAFITMENGCRVSVPNRLFTANCIVNHSRPLGPKRLDVDVGIDVRVPADRVMDMLRGEAFKAARNPGLARTPEPDVVISKIDSDATTYTVRFWYQPDELLPSSARSLVLAALQDVILQNALPLPSKQVEMVSAPDIKASLGIDEIKAGLSHAAIFRNVLSDEQNDELAARSKLIEIPRGTVLMRQGDPPASMYIVLEGAVSITIGNNPDQQNEVAVSATGDVIGEISLMTGAPRTATVVALTRLRVLEITKEAVQGLLDESPELFERISRVLAERQLANESAAQRKLDSESVEEDILGKMMRFFSRTFGAPARPRRDVGN